jgi:hypothetical protein
LWGVLDFVYQYRRLESPQKKSGIFPRQGSNGGIIKSNISPAFLAKVPEQRRLADLPWSGQQKDGELFPGVSPTLSQRAWIVHGNSSPSDMQDDCIMADRGRAVNARSVRQPQCAAALLHAKRSAFRTSRARTGFRSTYRIAVHTGSSSSGQGKNRHCHKRPLIP